MAKEKLLQAKYGSDEKPLRIGDIEIPCYVLENGQRVLSQSGLYKALGITRGGTRTSSAAGARLTSFMSQKAIEPFINKDLIPVLQEPLKFTLPKGGTIALGYDAELLQTIVRAISKAYIAGKLSAQREFRLLKNLV